MNKNDFYLLNDTTKLLFKEPVLKALKKVAVLESLNECQSKYSLQNEKLTSVDEIGVWKKQSSGEWIRSEKYYDDWSCWADVEMIPVKKKNVKRIVLIGESVARGYIYDPVLTPAKLLESCLNKSSSEQYEIVDMARIDITAVQLISLSKKLFALEPDYICLFAGNNWLQLDSMTSIDISRIAAILKNEGISEAKEYFKENCVKNKIESLIRAISNIADDVGARPICVIPEFNLRDWKVDINQPKLAVETENEVEVDDEDFQLMADRCIKSGDFAKAKEYLIKLRDAVEGLPIRFTPRATHFIQTHLQDFAEKNNFDLINLPEIFSNHAVSGIPGYDLFIDYCHLNLEGLNILTNHLASLILEKDITDSRPVLSKNDRAASYFIAAIHCAHYGQPESTVKKFIISAIDSDESIKEIFTLFLTAHRKDIPIWMTAGFSKLFSYSKIFERYLLPRLPKQVNSMLDSVLITSILECMNLSSYPSVEDGLEYNLLDEKFWLESNASRFNYDLSIPRLYFVAKNQISMFTVFKNKSMDIEFELVLKGRDDRLSDEVSIFHGNKKIAKLSLEDDWKKYRLVIPFASGKNEIKIHWPDNKMRISNASLSDALEMGEMPSMFRDFGYIHSFMSIKNDPSSTKIKQYDELSVG